MTYSRAFVLLFARNPKDRYAEISLEARHARNPAGSQPLQSGEWGSGFRILSTRLMALNTLIQNTHMDEKELYEKKMEAKLEEWKADLRKLKAQAEAASADMTLAFKEHMNTLADKIEEGEHKLEALTDRADDAWDEFREDLESAWNKIKSQVSESTQRYEKED